LIKKTGIRLKKRRIMDEKSHHQGKIYIPVKNRPKSNRRIEIRNFMGADI